MPANHKRLIAALLLSAAVHALLFVPAQPAPESISLRSIIHARLDKQNRELVQQAQSGQLERAEAKSTTQQSQLSDAAEKVVKEQTESAAKQQEATSEKKLTTDTASNNKVKQTKELSDQEKIEQITTESSEQPAETEPQAANPQSNTQKQQLSQAQVEAISGNEDPTYTSYLKVLSQYLGQRLQAKAGMKGNIRLKIKIQYGSIATSVKVIDSSGDQVIDDWAIKAALAANPYPSIPKELGSTFEFSPTLKLGE